ncbi:MAG: sensor histidine kinase [Halodesulfurarchaeum sp.]
MSGAADWRRAAGAGLVTGVAGYFTSVHVHHAVQPLQSLQTMLFGITIPLALSLGLFVVAALLATGSLEGSPLRIGTWCLIGTVVTGLSGLLIVLSQLSAGRTVGNLVFLIGDIGTYGAIGGLVVGVYDAKQREVSQRLAVERERAQNLSTRLSVLNRVLRHDIRTNVTIIKGHANQLLRGEDDPHEAARIIRERADGLHELSEQARRIEDYLSDMQAEQRAIDLPLVIRESVESLRDEFPQATIETDLPEHVVTQSSPMLGEAIEHLVRNGLEHNGESPWVRVEGTLTGANVRLIIEDDGPGVPTSEIEVLEQGEETAMEHTSGIGLWVAKWVIEASGGELTIDDRDPAGTTVTVTLPAYAG